MSIHSQVWPLIVFLLDCWKMKHYANLLSVFGYAVALACPNLKASNTHIQRLQRSRADSVWFILQKSLPEVAARVRPLGLLVSLWDLNEPESQGARWDNGVSLCGSLKRLAPHSSRAYSPGRSITWNRRAPGDTFIGYFMGAECSLFPHVKPVPSFASKISEEIVAALSM